MLQNFFRNIFSKNCSFEPTTDQSNALDILSEFFNSPKEVCVINGFAGTGKTTLIRVIVSALKELEIPVVLMAPTGRAAKVLNSYTKTPASTVHKKIYRQQSGQSISKFAVSFNTLHNAVFIVDEASMLSNETQEYSVFGTGNVLDDLFTYVFSRQSSKILLVGDTAQLPPIGFTVSPALCPEIIEQTYLKTVTCIKLTQVVRQGSESGVLLNATDLRLKIEKNTMLNPSILVLDDCVKLSGADLLESLEKSYNTVGVEDTMVICRSNKTAYQYNEGIRRMILWKENSIAAGDLIMVVKNNYYWCKEVSEIDFIANGDIAEIIKVGKFEEMYGFTFVTATIRLVDYQDIELTVKLLIDSISTVYPALSPEQNQQLYGSIIEDYAEITNKRKKFDLLKQNEYYNALQIKFANAVTCHKAQGGQWKHIYIDYGYLPEETVDVEFLRWLYTSFTRATEKVFLVNFKDAFFKA